MAVSKRRHTHNNIHSLFVHHRLRFGERSEVDEMESLAAQEAELSAEVAAVVTSAEAVRIRGAIANAAARVTSKLVCGISSASDAALRLPNPLTIITSSANG